MLKLIILKHHPQTYLLGKLTELDEEPSLLIEDCFSVTPEGDLQQYPLHTDQRYLFLTSDQIMTMLDAAPALSKKYKDTVNE